MYKSIMAFLLTMFFSSQALGNFSYKCIELERVTVAGSGLMTPAYPGRSLTFIWNGKKITKRYIWSHFSNKKTKNMFSSLEKRYFLHNALAIYKKHTLKKIPFDENLTSKEDRYWANKIIKKKMNFIYEPELIAEHQYTIHGNTWKGIA